MEQETQCKDTQLRFGNPLAARVFYFAWRGFWWVFVVIVC